MRLRSRLPNWLILTLAYLFVIVSVALPASAIPLQLLARTTPVRNAEIPPEHHEIPTAKVAELKMMSRRPRRVHRFETLCVQVLWSVAHDQLRAPVAEDWVRTQVHLPPRGDYLASPLGLRAPPAA
ncbi:MAG: hypothetical protein ACK47B_03965 [Armatimonadota bacterium]